MRVSSNTPILARRSVMRGATAALASGLVPVATVAAQALAPMTAAEFLAECDRIGYLYYTDTRNPPSCNGGPSVTVTFPEGRAEGASEKWLELMRRFDDRTPEFARYLLKIGRTQHAWESLRDGTFVPKPDFETEWDAGLYIDHMASVGMPCRSIYRGERLVACQFWIPENVGSDEPRKCEQFLAELKRRGRAHQIPAGMSLHQFEKRLDGRGLAS